MSTITKPVGDLVSSDLGARVVDVEDAPHYFRSGGVLVLAAHNARLGQTYVGLSEKPGRRDTRGIHVNPDRRITLEAAT